MTFRMTIQRKVILDELKKLNKLKIHPTADEVYALVKKHLPRISLATVYRNLELLARAGLIQAVEIPGQARRYDGSPEEHFHIVCSECGQIADVKLSSHHSLENSIIEDCGYEVHGYFLEFRGLCPKCKQKMRDPRKGGRR